MVRVPLLKIPSHGDGTATYRPIAMSMGKLFARAPVTVMDDVLAWLRRRPIQHHNLGPFRAEELRHELSQYMVAECTDEFCDGRSLIEFEKLVKGGLPYIRDVAVGSFTDFCETLLRMHRAFLSGPSNFRSQPISSMADRSGDSVFYPRSSTIVPQLARIHAHWQRYVYIEPGFAAVVAMTALVNLHPFIDGNGRVARLFFNWTINAGRRSPVYLPIYELSALSQCGFLIRLRQAQYYGEWLPLVCLLWRCATQLFAVSDRQLPSQGL